jgi:hypothetical protein
MPVSAAKEAQWLVLAMLLQPRSVSAAQRARQPSFGLPLFDHRAISSLQSLRRARYHDQLLSRLRLLGRDLVLED